MPYTASQIIREARSLSDFQNAETITYEDELQLINEAYRDIYNRYTESDGDYWVNEVIIDLGSQYLDPNAQNAYLIPLPSDFYKIRWVSYKNNTMWSPVNRFSTADRDDWPGVPMYRIKNDDLWIISPLGSIPQIKMGYYIPPQVVTAPQDSIQFQPDLPAYNVPNIKSVFYIADDILLFAYGFILKVDNGTANNQTIDLYTHTNPIDNVVYYRGYAYFKDTVTSGIYRHTTDLSTPFVTPTLILSNVNNFVIQNNKIIYSTAAITQKSNLDGSTPVLVSSSPTISYQYAEAKNTVPVYIDASSSTIVVGGVLSNVTNAVRLTTYLGQVFWLDSNQDWYQATYDPVTHVLSTPVLRQEGVLKVGNNVGSNFYPVVGEGVFANDLTEDTIFDYPSNEVNEIMTYSSAFGYSRKINDLPKMQSLTSEIVNLWDRFWSVNRRDEYQFQRINNYYKDDTGGYGWGAW